MYNAIAAERWCRAADEGLIVVPHRMTGSAENAMLNALRLAVRRRQRVTLYIDCIEGTAAVWDMVDLLSMLPYPKAVIERNATSAGLIIAVACEHRVAHPDTEFLYHGIDRRDHDADDERRAQWFAERTTTPAEFWLQKAREGDTRFGAQKAMSMGVVHEVRDETLALIAPPLRLQ